MEVNSRNRVLSSVCVRVCTLLEPAICHCLAPRVLENDLMCTHTPSHIRAHGHTHRHTYVHTERRGSRKVKAPEATDFSFWNVNVDEDCKDPWARRGLV